MSFLPIDDKLDIEKLINSLACIRGIVGCTSFNITYAIVLLAIFKGEPIAFRTVKKDYGIGASNMSRAIDALVHFKLVYRSKGDDKRRLFLYMTEEGRDRMQFLFNAKNDEFHMGSVGPTISPGLLTTF